jgi:ferredoxin
VSGLGRLLRAAESFRSPSVVVVARLCTHRHHQGSACSRCVDACPTRAVTVSAEGPHVDTVSCVDCGACVAACPTGALAPLHPTDQALTEKIVAGAADGEVTISCSQVAGADRGEVVVACAARLDPSHLLTALAAGAASVTVCSGACEKCAKKGVLSPAESVVADTAEIVALFGLSGRVLVEQRSERRGDAGEAARPDRAAGEAGTVAVEAVERASSPGLRSTAVTRRGFFGLLRHGGTYAAAQAAGVLAGPPEAVVDEGPRRELLVHASTRRARLLAALRALVPGSATLPDTGTLFLAPALEAAACDRCGLCGRLCPTGALTLREDEDGAFLSVGCRPEDCVACGLCVEVCGRGALTLTPARPGPVLAPALEPTTIVERERSDAPPEVARDEVRVSFDDEIRVSFEDKMQRLLGVQVRRT